MLVDKMKTLPPQKDKQEKKHAENLKPLIIDLARLKRKLEEEEDETEEREEYVRRMLRLRG